MPRPLVIHPGAIGDLIRLTAMLRALSQRWGGSCDVLARHGAAPLIFAGLDSVGEVGRFPSRGRPFLISPEQWRLVRWLRRRPPGPVYLIEERRHLLAPWSRHTRMEWLLRKAGVPTDRVVDVAACPRRPLENVVDFELRMAAVTPPALSGRAEAPGPAPGPELAVAPDEIADCRRWVAARGWDGAPLVLAQAEARRTNRGRWPIPKWTRLIGQVLEREPQARVLLIGAPHERARIGSLAVACDDERVEETTADLPLRRLFALLTLAHSLISLDTGPAHAAAALGCPLVVLAGRADPRRNRPIGPPQRVRVVTAWEERDWPESPHVWFQTHDLAAISVDAVFEAWRELA